MPYWDRRMKIEQLEYWQKVKSVSPGNLIVYWPLWEQYGATAYDLSGYGRNGTYTGVALNSVDQVQRLLNPGFETAGGGGADIWANWTETGRWLPGHRPGWSHQKAFVDALQMAKRLARRLHLQEALAAVNESVRAAQMASPSVMRNMVKLATAQAANKDVELEPVLGIEHKDQVAAAKVVLGYAKPDGAASEEEDAANDWWSAAEG